LYLNITYELKLVRYFEQQLSDIQISFKLLYLCHILCHVLSILN